METKMNKALLATAALAALVAFGSPASAQLGNEAMVEPSAAAVAQARAQTARAQAVPVARRGGLAHSTNPAHDVYDTQGNYLSSDPDPNVRAMIALDTPDSDE
jgi:hypothetical protein